jgi:hypothetical protein
MKNIEAKQRPASEKTSVIPTGANPERSEGERNGGTCFSQAHNNLRFVILSEAKNPSQHGPLLYNSTPCEF